MKNKSDESKRVKSKRPARSDWGLDAGTTPTSLTGAMLQIFVGWFRPKK
ncbi:MAG: hypothetical protein ACSHX6_15065 [Akkermansiaceae bacterium]